MRHISFLAVLLMISACDQEAPPPDPALVEGTNPAATAAPQSGTEGGPAMPNILIGAWDYEKGTCDPGSEMRLEIDTRQLRFYESLGQVTAVRPDGAATIVDLAMEGEGESWTETLRFVLKDGGTRLHITEPQTQGDVDEYPRRRCPA